LACLSLIYNLFIFNKMAFFMRFKHVNNHVNFPLHMGKDMDYLSSARPQILEG
jgi:hypothetical protein